MEIYLTRDIDHEGVYADEVVAQIKSIPKGLVLRMLITSNGGSTTHGDRIYRAIQEHSGKTEAVVIGRAASMAASLLSAFDEVSFDEGAELMFHKAHIEGADGKLTKEQEGIINRFNMKTYQRLKEKGVDAGFLSKVFLSETAENYWLTAEEAEDLGIGKVDVLDRSKYVENYKAAASFKEIKNENKEGMNLFKKSVPRIVNLADGRQAIFESKDEELKVGNTLVLVGSSDKLSGKIAMSGNVVAEVDEEGKVVNMEEGAEGGDVNAEIEAMKAEIAEIKQMLMELARTEAKAEGEDEEKDKEAEAKVSAANDLLAKALEAVNTIKSTFQPPKVENKNEVIANEFKGLSESEKRAIEMKNTIKAL